jgi:F420-dependent oxidoreductase-like protein
MRIGVFFPTKEQGTLDEMAPRLNALRERGLNSAWFPQSSGFDALTALSVISRDVPELELGTSVIPSYPRHPVMLAVQALTANAAMGGRLALGIGLSHKMAIEGAYNISYDKPARHMREYLSILMPLLHDNKVAFEGETLTGRSTVTIPGGSAPPVLLAALQPLMLKLAGEMGDGTITWCTGPITIEEQIVPIMTEAAAAAGRPAPRVVVPLPTIVCDDEADGRVKADGQLEGYGRIPVYRAVLDREGVEGPGDVSIVGDEASVTAQLKRLKSIGTTDFVAIPCGSDDDRRRTLDHLATLT